MSTFKDTAKAKFKEKLESVGEFYVEEWDTTIYFKPQTMKEIGALEEGRAGANSPEIVVNHVIARARNENMELLFKPVERIEIIREYDPDTLADISLAMNKWDAELKKTAGN